MTKEIRRLEIRTSESGVDAFHWAFGFRYSFALHPPPQYCCGGRVIGLRHSFGIRPPSAVLLRRTGHSSFVIPLAFVIRASGLSKGAHVGGPSAQADRKSIRLNSSHTV